MKAGGTSRPCNSATNAALLYAAVVLKCCSVEGSEASACWPVTPVLQVSRRKPPLRDERGRKRKSVASSSATRELLTACAGNLRHARTEPAM